ncbi:hypothetical protein [Halorarum salinum]|uniref:DUF456 domain-containing protein n=1 Tax=Halorarum salinum TaxID=2743089 RepID=A0A7D5QM77_9EURY|nr:hypothetical protein [Halobaculum salinum]QLG63285.1 hypothetical protein HUG12_16720 [Halobaculum salinum]
MGNSVEELKELAERDVGDAGSGDGEREETAPSGDSGSSRTRGRLLGRSPVTLRGFLFALLACVAGLVAGSAVPLVGGFTRYLGLAVGAFLLGLLRSRRSYLEVGAAGALTAAGVFILSTLTTGGFVVGSSLVSEYGVPLVGVGTTVGFLLSLTGYYFGRDLRDGLTRDV